MGLAHLFSLEVRRYPFLRGDLFLGFNYDLYYPEWLHVCCTSTSRPCGSDRTLWSWYALRTLGTLLSVRPLRARMTVLPVGARVTRRPLQSRVAGRAGVPGSARGSLWAGALVGLAVPVLAVLALALLAVVGGGHVDDPVSRLRADAVLNVRAVEQRRCCQIFSSEVG